MPQTTSVAVTFSLHSLASAPPYEMSDCNGTISYADGSSAPFSGWVAEIVGTPQPAGASFTVSVQDLDYAAGSNQAGVAAWALTFIPRGATNAQSPFGNNQNTISGTGATNANGTFTLDLGNVKIKNAGDWDWALMVQMTTGGAIKCFASDPEMEVGA